MATIESLIERIEKRLFLVSGIDVQLHAEDQLIEMLRGVYDTLFDDFWYPEYTYFMSGTLDGTTGQITADIDTQILRYKDIHSVFWDEDEVPLPQVMPGTSLNRIRRRSVMPSANPQKVFKVVPVDETGPVHIWYRTKIADSVWEDNELDTQIPFDDDVLMYGVVYEFLLMDGSNDSATAEYKNKYQGRQKQMRDAQWQIPISKRKLERDGPLTRWE